MRGHDDRRSQLRRVRASVPIGAELLLGDMPCNGFGREQLRRLWTRVSDGTGLFCGYVRVPHGQRGL